MTGCERLTFLMADRSNARFVVPLGLADCLCGILGRRGLVINRTARGVVGVPSRRSKPPPYTEVGRSLTSDHARVANNLSPSVRGDDLLLSTPRFMLRIFFGYLSVICRTLAVTTGGRTTLFLRGSCTRGKMTNIQFQCFAHIYNTTPTPFPLRLLLRKKNNFMFLELVVNITNIYAKCYIIYVIIIFSL